MNVLAKWNKHLGLVRFTIAALPIVGSHFNRLKLVWPPIGSAFVFGAYFVAVLAWLLSRSALTFRTQQKARHWMVAGLVLCAISLTAYGYLLSKYVVSIPTPKDGTQYRTIGSVRTAAANRIEALIPSVSDERLIEIAGLNDDAIKEMWTADSVSRVRLELFAAVAALWCSANFSAGAFARSSFSAG